MISFAASLPLTLSINNANISSTSLAGPPVNNTLYLPSSGPYVIYTKDGGNITIVNFDGAFVRTDYLTDNLWRMLRKIENQALAAVLDNDTMNSDTLSWSQEDETSGKGYSEFVVLLGALPTMTWEHVLLAMAALIDWVEDKTAKSFGFFLAAEGVGRVAYGAVTRDDYTPDADS